ncbi:Intracellular growth attenuator protein igaA [compost metagenome]
MLLKTPFSAEGIITGIKQDANGTQHITLHKIPDSSSLWRYISTTLLLICMIACLLINGVLAIRRFRRSRSRLAQIQQYYDNCMNPSLTTISAVRPLF